MKERTTGHAREGYFCLSFLSYCHSTSRMASEGESEELSFHTYFHSVFFFCLAFFLPVHTVPCLIPGLPFALRWWVPSPLFLLDLLFPLHCPPSSLLNHVQEESTLSCFQRPHSHRVLAWVTGGMRF